MGGVGPHGGGAGCLSAVDTESHCACAGAGRLFSAGAGRLRPVAQLPAPFGRQSAVKDGRFGAKNAQGVARNGGIRTEPWCLARGFPRASVRSVRRSPHHVVLTAAPGASPADEEPPETGDRHRLTAVTGLAALSLDAMASVAYGPEAIVLVLAAAGAHGLGFTLPVTLAIAALPAVLIASYRQVIAAFPDGDGSYAVARAHLGKRTSLVAAASLVLDYVLNVAVAVTAGVAALTSAFPALHDDRLWLCLAVLVLVTATGPS